VGTDSGQGWAYSGWTEYRGTPFTTELLEELATNDLGWTTWEELDWGQRAHWIDNEEQVVSGDFDSWEDPQTWAARRKLSTNEVSLHVAKLLYRFRVMNPETGTVYRLAVGHFFTPEGASTSACVGASNYFGYCASTSTPMLVPAVGAELTPPAANGHVSATVLKVDMKAYRPQTEGPGYGSPFLKHEVPDAVEESPGVGIRHNGDDDDSDSIIDRSDSSVSGEDDLIEVTLVVDPPSPSGVEYVLRRSNSDLQVWGSATKEGMVLAGCDEAIITFSNSTKTVWVEQCGSSATTDLEFVGRPTGTSEAFCKDTLHFYKFKSVVILFEGEGRLPHDPPTTGDGLQDLKGVGISSIALNLYTNGFDVHNYEDSPSSVGFAEAKSAVTERDVDHIALIGYSHGAGSVYDVSVDLNADPTTFNLAFTAYIDAIAQPAANPLPEMRRPVNTSFHVNYYQEIQLGEIPLQGGASFPQGAGDEDNVDRPTATESHLTIDDAANIQATIINYLRSKVDR
jgi:hypothetical protein